MVQKAQGVVTPTAYEYEPGASNAIESTFGGKCFQVGYVCFILTHEFAFTEVSTLADLRFLSDGGLAPSTNPHPVRTI